MWCPRNLLENTAIAFRSPRPAIPPEMTQQLCLICWRKEVEIGGPGYMWNWVLANCHYDLLLGIPWHSETSPYTDYNSGTVTVDWVNLHRRTSIGSAISIGNIDVKKIHWLLRWKYNPNLAEVQLMHVGAEKKGTPGRIGESEDNPEIAHLKKNFHRSFATICRGDCLQNERPTTTLKSSPTRNLPVSFSSISHPRN